MTENLKTAKGKVIKDAVDKVCEEAAVLSKNCTFYFSIHFLIKKKTVL